MKRITAIYRAERFSPNNVENDRMILRMVLSGYEKLGYEIIEIKEEELIACGLLPHCDLILTMARSKEALDIIKNALRNGVATRCINSPEGISACSDRSLLNRIMQENGVETPPENGADGVWLKRTKGYSECKNDVVFCKTDEEISAAMEAFHARGIDEVTQQAHIQGDLVKFYGIANAGFFHITYPNDLKRSKFGMEEINGAPNHYAFSHSALRDSMNRIANAIGVPIYGGDAVIRADGSFVVIDFNDWPSFSTCREEAGKQWIIDNG